MIKSSIHTAVAAMLVAMGAAGSAQAFTIPPSFPLDGYEITITNFDSATTKYTGDCSGVSACNSAGTPALGSVGSVNTSADSMGIFSIDRIVSSTTGDTVYHVGDGGVYLTGIFSNLVDYSVSSTPGSSGSTDFSVKSQAGGIMVWANPTDYSAAPGPTVSGSVDLNAYLYPTISSGTLWLSGNFVSGAILGDTTTTYTNQFNNKTLAGVGQGFIDITGGSAAGSFAKAMTDLNGVDRSLFLKTTFGPPQDFAIKQGWTVQSAGQLTSAIPEPSTLALVALGMLVVGGAARRSRT